MAYATLAQLRTHLDVSSTNDDSLLSDLIVRSQSMIDAHCMRRFEAASDTTKLFDAERDVSADGRTLYILDDLAQLTTVVNGDGTTVAASAYVKRAEGLVLKASTGILWTYTTDPEDAISVTGRWAHSVSAPPDIVHACIRLAAYMYRQRDTNMNSDRPMVADGVMIMPARIPDDVKSILQSKRRVGR